MTRKKLGIALGSGAAKGLAHIGVLKELQKNGIKPDYIAGTSMGAVIGALYCLGNSAEEIHDIAKTTPWKNLVDFTIPKSGLIKGNLVRAQLEKLLQKKEFKNLRIPLQVVSYDLLNHRKVTFSKGKLSRAVRASISIPGVFEPPREKGHLYIDGSVSDPIPYDVVRKMGADVIIAVDISGRDLTVFGHHKHKSLLQKQFRQRFISQELLNVENYIFPHKWPIFFRKTMKWIFKRFIYPKKILKIMVGKELPMITKVLYETVTVMSNNLSKERIKNANVDFKIHPVMGNLTWTDFDKVDEFVKAGEKAMQKEIRKLKLKLGR